MMELKTYIKQDIWFKARCRLWPGTGRVNTQHKRTKCLQTRLDWEQKNWTRHFFFGPGTSWDKHTHVNLCPCNMSCMVHAMRSVFNALIAYMHYIYIFKKSNIKLLYQIRTDDLCDGITAGVKNECGNGKRGQDRNSEGAKLRWMFIVDETADRREGRERERECECGSGKG